MNEDNIPIFGPNPVLGTFKGVNYSDFLLDLKLNNPEEYHKLDLAYLLQQLNSNSDFTFVKDLEGNIHRVLNIKGLSGADPVGQFYVEGVALGPVFKGVGRAAEYGLAKAGNNWARARIVSRALNNNVNNSRIIPTIPTKVKVLTIQNLPPDRYYSISPRRIYFKEDGTWDFDKIVKDIQKGRDDAVSFLKSDVRKRTLEKNKQEAIELGYDGFLPYEGYLRALIPIKPDLYTISDPTSNIGGLLGVASSPEDDILQLNAYWDLNRATFHEMLHRGQYGVSPRVYLLPSETNSLFAKRVRDTTGYYEYKTNLIIRPRSEIVNDGLDLLYYDYLTDRGETPANLLEVGREMGIKIGLEYPGDETFLKMIESFKNTDNYNPNIFSYFKLDPKSLKNLFKALNGTYYVTIPTIISKLYSRNNK